MSILRLEDFNRDPFEYLRRLERLSRLNADRVAFARFYATPPPAKTEPQSPSVLTSVARPTDQPATPPASGPAKEF